MRATPGFDSRIALVVCPQGVDRVENRNVNDGHGTTGPGRSELLSKHPTFSGRDRCVIETARINRDLVPPMQRIKTCSGSSPPLHGMILAEALAVRISKAIRSTLRSRKKE